MKYKRSNFRNEDEFFWLSLYGGADFFILGPMFIIGGFLGLFFWKIHYTVLALILGFILYTLFRYTKHVVENNKRMKQGLNTISFSEVLAREEEIEKRNEIKKKLEYLKHIESFEKIHGEKWDDSETINGYTYKELKLFKKKYDKLMKEKQEKNYKEKQYLNSQGVFTLVNK